MASQESSCTASSSIGKLASAVGLGRRVPTAQASAAAARRETSAQELAFLSRTSTRPQETHGYQTRPPILSAPPRALGVAPVASWASEFPSPVTHSQRALESAWSHSVEREVSSQSHHRPMNTVSAPRTIGVWQQRRDWAAPPAMHHHHPQMTMPRDQEHQQLQSNDQSAAWVEEFQALSVQSSTLTNSTQAIDATSAQDALSQTARVLVDAVAHNPKVSGSQFVEYMRKIRDKEVDLGQESINKPPGPLQGAQDWAKELLGLENINIQSRGWEEDFTMSSNDQALQDRPRIQTLDEESITEATWAQRNLPPPTIGRPDYQGFQRPFESSFDPATTVQTNWDGAFQQAAASMDTSEKTETVPESQQEQVNADEMEQAFRDFYGKGHDEWANEFKKDLDGMKGRRVEELEQMEQDWSKAHPSTDSNILQGDPNVQSSSAYDHYAYTPNNPFLSLPFGKNKELALSDLEGSHMTVTEKILRLEAHLQCSQNTSLDSNYWLQLGRAQQENENDTNAIAALKQGLALDPNQSEPWLLLAASYTNENCKHEACECLFSWLNHHQQEGASPTAHGIPIMKRGSLPEKEDFLRKEFAALTGMNGQRPDPHLQVGWGILCTLGGNFVNAVDCFEAALASRPEVFISHFLIFS